MDFYGENNDRNFEWNSQEPKSNDLFQEGQNQMGPPSPHRSRKPMSPKTKGSLKVIALCLVCALIGALVQPVSGLFGEKSTTLYTGQRTPTQVETTAVDTSKEMTNAEIYAAYAKSSVGITVDLVSTNIFGQTVTGAAAGSGFVISEDGYILTNYHVIDGANAITVTFIDGTTYTATLVGGEADNDIAVIKIDATGLTPVVIGSSSDMLVGETVSTIGNPLGELTFSQTSGIVSALNRSITMSDGQKMNMIQTDCAINSGNSGGPLFNVHGEVIGIVSAKYSSGSSYSTAASVEGLGFAIPIDDVADMVSDLITNGYVTGKPLLGISVEDVDEAATQYGIPAGGKVTTVTADLCAAKAGIQVGDIITKMGDTEVTSADELIATKNTYKAGDTVEFTLYRNGETMTVSVTLDEDNTENSAKQDATIQEYQQSQQAQQPQQSQQGQQYGGSWPYSYGYGYDY